MAATAAKESSSDLLPPQRAGKLARAVRTCHPALLKSALRDFDRRVEASSSSTTPPGSEAAATELNEALFEAADRCEDPGHLEVLVGHGADVAARDATQRTPLHVACSPSWLSSQAAVLARRERGAEMVAWLLAHRADPCAADRAGYTPLHSAALVGDDAGARELLAYRADPNATTARGATPMEIIESTCWSHRSASQAQCEQHGHVVALITGAGGRCAPSNAAVSATGTPATPKIEGQAESSCSIS